MIIEMRVMEVKWGDNSASDFREPIQVRAQDVALEDQVGALALADDLDQAGRLQLLDVMGDRRRAHAVRLVQDAAGHRARVGPDLHKEPITARFGQCTGDPRKLLVAQFVNLGFMHGNEPRARDELGVIVEAECGSAEWPSRTGPEGEDRSSGRRSRRRPDVDAMLR